MTEFLQMCFEFFKTGLFAVGGGLATLPFLRDISTSHPNWFSISDMADMLAVSESTPGPIGVNMATYVGYKVFGILGGICATLSLTLPSFIIVLIVAKIWEKYKTNEKVMKVFAALRAAAIGLIISAGVDVFSTAVILDGALSVGCLILFIALFACTFIPKVKKLHPIFFILVAGVAGIIFKL